MTRVQMSRFPIHDEETAPAEAQALLKIASAAGGQLPNFLGVLSNSPATLRWLKPVATQRGELNDLLHEEVREAGWRDAELIEAIAVVALETLIGNVNRAGDVPSDGSTEQTRHLRAVA